MTCASEGCDRKGEWAVEAHVPAKGWAIDAHQPLSILCSMPLCRDHASEANLLKTFPELAQVVRSALAASGYIEPDFERAWCTPLRRSAPKFLQFERRQGGKAH